jgi:hypothetical protein
MQAVGASLVPSAAPASPDARTCLITFGWMEADGGECNGVSRRIISRLAQSPNREEGLAQRLGIPTTWDDRGIGAPRSCYTEKHLERCGSGICRVCSEY